MLLYARGSRVDKEPIAGNLWVQKEMFVISRNYGDFADEFDPYYLGPFSEQLESQIDQLAVSGFVKKEGKIALTPKGEKLAEQLWNDSSGSERELISDVKSRFNDLTDEELLAFIYQSYPEMTIHSRVKEDIDRKRKQLALRLFQRKKISLEKAAEIANQSIAEFTRILEDHNIAAYSLSKKQFDSEEM